MKISKPIIVAHAFSAYPGDVYDVGAVLLERSHDDPSGEDE